MKEREQAASEKTPPPQAMSNQELLKLDERLAKAVVYTGEGTDETLYIDTSGQMINSEGLRCDRSGRLTAARGKPGKQRYEARRPWPRNQGSHRSPWPRNRGSHRRRSNRRRSNQATNKASGECSSEVCGVDALCDSLVTGVRLL